MIVITEVSRNAFLVALAFTVGGFLLIALVVRPSIYYHAFYGMSKTRRRKIVKGQNRLNYILMTYVTKYSYPKATLACLVLYWLYCLALILVLFFSLVNVFIEVPLPSTPTTLIFAFATYTPVVHVILMRLLPIKKRKNQKQADDRCD